MTTSICQSGWEFLAGRVLSLLCFVNRPSFKNSIDYLVFMGSTLLYSIHTVHLRPGIHMVWNSIGHAPLTEHRALRHKLKSCTVPFLYRSDLVKSRRMLYRPDVCNCTMPYVTRTVPAFAVRDPAYTAEVFALTLVEIDVRYICRTGPQARLPKICTCTNTTKRETL